MKTIIAQYDSKANKFFIINCKEEGLLRTAGLALLHLYNAQEKVNRIFAKKSAIIHVPDDLQDFGYRLNDKMEEEEATLYEFCEMMDADDIVADRAYIWDISKKTWFVRDYGEGIYSLYEKIKNSIKE